MLEKKKIFGPHVLDTFLSLWLFIRVTLKSPSYTQIKKKNISPPPPISYRTQETTARRPLYIFLLFNWWVTVSTLFPRSLPKVTRLLLWASLIYLLRIYLTWLPREIFAYPSHVWSLKLSRYIKRILLLHSRFVPIEIYLSDFFFFVFLCMPASLLYACCILYTIPTI